MLDARVHEDYAGALLPRAVGYGAALLDYFFRGRLDVDLVDDGDGLRLVGTNASTDALDGGTLTLYADGDDGLRRPASESIAVGRAGPGDALPAVPVTGPAGAERFVAVYTGTLGEERPVGAFPGAVIGKVLGGARVEEVRAVRERPAELVGADQLREIRRQRSLPGRNSFLRHTFGLR